MARFLARTRLNITNIKEVDEYRSLIPENNQYEELKKAIQEQGFLFPVIVNKNGELLDGYTRLRIARELGISEIPVEIYETSGREEELDIIASLNLKRRQLSKDELVLLIDKIHEIKKKLRKTNELSQNETNNMSPHSISASGNEKNTTPSVTEESREILEELKRLVPDAEINPETVRYYFQVKEGAPWLIQYIGDHKKGKIGIRKAYDIYQLLKRKNLLDLNQRIPKTELDQLISTSDGRKVLEDDELLQQILAKKLAVSQAINIIKTKKASSEPRKAAEPEEERGGPKRGGTESEAVSRVQAAVQEVKEEKKPEKRKKEELPPTKLEIIPPKDDIESLYRAMPSVKELVDKGILTEDDVSKIYEIWRNMYAIFLQASLLWYNSVDKLLKSRGIPDDERADLFYEMTRPYYRLFPKEEVFPKEVLEGESDAAVSGTTPKISAPKSGDRPSTSTIPQLADFLSELRRKGFAELPTEIALVKVDGKCYAISVEALRDLEQGIPERWKDLEAFLNKHGILIPGEVEGVYVVPWKLLGRCEEWR